MTTINDVAHRAGVTSATVSNVLTGRVGVSEKTRSRVQKAIEELGYRPNLVARGLAQGKTHTIALIVPTITNPFFSEVAEEVERVADKHDYQIILGTTHRLLEQGRRHLERMSSRWVDGFIVIDMAAAISDVLAVAQRHKPIVLCAWNQELSANELPGVAIDFLYAGEVATQYLLEIGHRRIATIMDEPMQTERLQGYQRALTAAGIVPSSAYMRHGDSSFEGGYRATIDLLALPEPPTAIFAGNDIMALGVIEAATDYHRSVPGDISVVGVDDIMLANHAHPPLTTISIPKRQMAQIATELLLWLIAFPNSDEIPLKHFLRPHLVVRQSTAQYALDPPPNS